MKPKYRNYLLALVSALPLAATVASADTLYWDGGTNMNWDIFTDNWVGNVTWNNGTPDDAVFGATGAGAITISAIQANSLTFNDPGYVISGGTLNMTGACGLTAVSDAAISSVITGTNGLEKLGAGVLTLTGLNTYTGVTDVSEGTLRLGDGTTQPTVNSTYAIASGATLKVQYTSVGASAQTWSKYTGAGSLAFATGKNNDAAFGTVGLGAGFTGTLQIESGRINTSTLASPGLGGTTAIVVKPGGQLGTWNGGTFNQTFTIAGTGYGEVGFEGALRFSNTGNLANATILTNSVTLAGNTTIGGSGWGIISGPIGESTTSNLTIGTSSMGGMVSLTGAATYTGTTTINYGTLRFGSRASFYNADDSKWTAANLIVNNNTTAAFNVGGTGEFTTSEIASLAGLGTATGGFLSGASIGVDTTNATATVEISTNLANTNGGANVLGFNKLGTGWLTLSGTNTNSGKITVSAGVLKFAKQVSLFNNGASAAWNATNLNILSGATLAFNVGGTDEFTSGNIDTIKGIASTNTAPGAGFRSTSYLGFDTTNASGGKFTYGSAIGTTPTVIGIAKLGAGTLEMTGSSTCTGGTIVYEGELLFSGTGSHLATSGNSLNLGTLSGSRAVLNLASSGNFNYYTTVNVGGAGASANGAGAIIKSGSGTVQMMNSTGYAQIGNGGYGSLDVSNGTLTFFGTAGARIGDNTGGLGVFRQTGGTVNFNRIFVIGGNSGTGPVGVATLTGGTVNGATSYHILLGNAGTASGTLNVGTQAGGTATLISKNGSGIRIGDTGNAGTPSGVINLNAGTIQFNAGGINRVNSNNGTTTGILNLNGGTLNANAAGLTMIDNSLTSTNLYNGGLTVDTQANTATISANILAATGNGIYPAGGAIAVTSGGGAGYIGSPIVTVTTGGSGAGATAVANVSAGVVTGVVLTSPGQGYQAGDTVSFAFSGGGSTTAATTFVYTLTAGDLAANGTGGLTKSGTGTLNLTGASTYGGATVINAGTVSLGSTWTSPNTGFQVKNTGTLQVTSTGKTLKGVTVDGGATLALPVSVTPTNVTNALTLNGSPNFTVRPVFFSAPQVGSYDLLVPASLSGTAGTITTDLSGLGLTRVAANTAVTGGKLVLNITNPGANLVWNGPTGGSWDLNTTANFTGAIPGTFMNLDSVTFGDTGAGTVNLAAGNLNPALVTVDSSLAYTFGGTGVIAGTGSLVKNGSGTLTISTAHSYLGSTDINGGVLSGATLVANGTNSSIGAGTTVNLNGGTLRYTGLNYGSDGGAKFDRNIVVGSNGGTLDITGTAGYIHFGGVLSGSGALNFLSSAGSGKQYLVASNSPSFSGPVVIGNGSAGSGFPQIRSNAPYPLGTGPITINGGGTLSADNGTTSPSLCGNSIFLNGGFLGTQAPTLTYSGSVTANPSTTSTVGTMGTSPGDVNLTGNLLGSGTISSTSGAATTRSVRLAGDNSGFSGIWQSTSSMTYFNSATAGSAAAKWVANGAALMGNITGGGGISLGELSGNSGNLGNLVSASSFTYSIGALNTDSTYGGSILNGSGTVGITKVGAGKLTLTGTLAYTGDTIVNSGTLQVNATNSTTVSVNTTVANGATLAVSGAANNKWETTNLTLGTGGATTLSLLNLSVGTTPRLGVSGTLAINGPVTLNLGGSFAVGTIPLIGYPAGYTPNLTQFTPSGLPRGVSASLVDNTTDGRIDLSVTGLDDLVWKGNNGADWVVGGTTTNWLLGATNEIYLDGDRVKFDDTGSNTDIVLDAVVTPGAVTFSNNSKAYSIIGLGGISGSIGLDVMGSGPVMIGVDNTYTGATTVAAGGILQLGDGTNDGTIVGPLVNDGATTFNPSSSWSYAGAISGSGTAITKIGTGTQIWTGTTNTFAGTVKVDEGTLQIGNATTNGNFGSSTYDIADGATLYLNYATAVQSTSAAPWTAQVKGAGTLRLNSAQAVSALANWGPNTDNPTVQTFGNDFTGTLMLDRGRFDSAPTGLGGISNIVIKDGSTLLTWSGTYNMSISLAGQGWGEASYPGTLRAAASAQTIWAGDVTLLANSNMCSQDGNSVLTITGSITGNYECMFIRNGNIIIAPTNPVQNSYGSTRVVSSGGSGTVKAGNAYAFSTGPLAMGGGALGLAGGTLDLNGFSFTFANLSGTGGTIGNYGTDPSTLTVGSDGSSTSCAAALVDGGTGTLELVKTGAGTLTLTGTNTYTGGTTISAGTLQVNSAASLPGSVANNGTLAFGNTAAMTFAGSISGTGSLAKSGAGNLTLTGSNSYTGNTSVNAGTLTLSSATLADTSTVTLGSGTVLVLNTAAADTVAALVINGTPVPDGTYGASHPTYGAYFAGSTGTLVVGGGYDSWAQQITNAADRDRTDDPDGDGFSNLQEFLFGTSPVAGNAALTTTERSGGNLIIRWKQLTSGSTYRLLESATLGNPWTLSGATVTNDGAQTGDYQPKKAEVPVGTGKNFFRVEGVEN